MIYLCFGGYLLQFSGLSPGSALSDHSWGKLEGHLQYWGLNADHLLPTVLSLHYFILRYENAHENSKIIRISGLKILQYEYTFIIMNFIIMKIYYQNIIIL